MIVEKSKKQLLTFFICYSWLIQDFMSLGVAIKGCVFSDKPCPVATVVVSQQTGSRTILFCAK